MKQATKPPKTPARQSEPKPETESVVKKPQSELRAYLRELNETQLRFCDLASDLLCNGGSQSDADLFAWALLHHERLRQFPDWPRDPKEREQDAIKYADEWAPKQLRKLMGTWPAKKKATERQEPNTVTEMAREHMRSRLEDELQDFVNLHADMENIYFMHEVVSTANSGYNLADAFQLEIGSDHTYVKVSREHVELVEKYIKAIEAKGENRGNAA